MQEKGMDPVRGVISRLSASNGVDVTRDLRTSFKITGQIIGGVYDGAKPHLKRYIGKKVQNVLSSDKIRF